MKYVLNLVLGILVCSASFAQQQLAYKKILPADLAYRKLTKEELHNDILFWNKIMEESHVDLYHSISRDGLLALETALMQELPDSVSHEKALLIIGRIAAALDEGHVGLPSSSLTDSGYRNSLRFPFIIQTIENGQFLVGRDISIEQKLSPGAYITAINGISTKALSEKYSLLFGGLDNWRLQQVGISIRKLLYLDGVVSPYTLSAVTADGKELVLEIAGLNRNQVDSVNKALAAAQPQRVVPYTYQLLDNGIGYISYLSMVNDRTHPFSEFLEETFRLIDSQKIKGLIIDIRQNGGGNSSLGEQMTGYFTETPYRFSAGMKWKISDPYKEFLKNKPGNNNGEDSFYLGRPSGTMYTYQADELKTPEKRKYRFRGKVAFLIGPNTFSSANMFADGVTTYHLAQVFGQPTGEPGNDFGEMFNFMLPNSGIIARGASKMFTRADGDEKNFAAIQPHVLVVPSKEDILQKRDVVLSAAEKWILD